MVLFTGSISWKKQLKGLNEFNIREWKLISKLFREKKILDFGKNQFADIEAISETTVVKANQQAIKGVPKEINDQMIQLNSQRRTVDLGHEALSRKLKKKAKKSLKKSKLKFLHDKEAVHFRGNRGTLLFCKNCNLKSILKTRLNLKRCWLRKILVWKSSQHTTIKKVVEECNQYVQAD